MVARRCETPRHCRFVTMVAGRSLAAPFLSGQVVIGTVCTHNSIGTVCTHNFGDKFLFTIYIHAG